MKRQIRTSLVQVFDDILGQIQSKGRSKEVVKGIAKPRRDGEDASRRSATNTYIRDEPIFHQIARGGSRRQTGIPTLRSACLVCPGETTVASPQS